MSARFESIPHHNAFDVLRNGHGLILTEFEVSRLSTALEGIHAITAVLKQRELDVDNDPGEGLTFGSTLAQGLISALATCAEYVQDTVDTGGMVGERAEHGTPAYEHLEAARLCIMQAKRKRAKP